MPEDIINEEDLSGGELDEELDKELEEDKADIAKQKEEDKE